MVDAFYAFILRFHFTLSFYADQKLRAQRHDFLERLSRGYLRLLKYSRDDSPPAVMSYLVLPGKVLWEQEGKVQGIHMYILHMYIYLYKFLLLHLVFSFHLDPSQREKKVFIPS